MDDIQKDIKELCELSVKVDDIKNRIDSHVKSVAFRYTQANRKIASYNYGPSFINGFEDWGVSDDTITINWSESWSYGGHDEGTVYFPIKYLTDESELVKFENFCEDREKKNILKESERVRKEKVDTFNRLKKELESLESY